MMIRFGLTDLGASLKQSSFTQGSLRASPFRVGPDIQEALGKLGERKEIERAHMELNERWGIPGCLGQRSLGWIL